MVVGRALYAIPQTTGTQTLYKYLARECFQVISGSSTEFNRKEKEPEVPENHQGRELCHYA